MWSRRKWDVSRRKWMCHAGSANPGVINELSPASPIAGGIFHLWMSRMMFLSIRVSLSSLLSKHFHFLRDTHQMLPDEASRPRHRKWEAGRKTPRSGTQHTAVRDAAHRGQGRSTPRSGTQHTRLPFRDAAHPVRDAAHPAPGQGRSTPRSGTQRTRLPVRDTAHPARRFTDAAHQTPPPKPQGSSLAGETGLAGSPDSASRFAAPGPPQGL
jgi:hypothetical protein